MVLLESLEKGNPISSSIKDTVSEMGITQLTLDYLKGFSALADAELSAALERPSLSPVLRMVTGLIVAHRRSQEQVVSSGVLALVHRMETDTRVKRVAENASFLLDELKDSEFADEVRRLRDATLSAKKKKAEEKRQQIMQQLNLSVKNTGEGAFIQSNTDAFLTECSNIEDESGIECIVCREVPLRLSSPCATLRTSCDAEEGSPARPPIAWCVKRNRGIYLNQRGLWAVYALSNGTRNGRVSVTRSLFGQGRDVLPRVLSGTALVLL